MAPFVHFVRAEYELYCEEKIYKLCISNAIHQYPRGKMPAKSFAEIIGLGGEEDNRSGDEIARDVISKLGLEVEE